MNWEGQLKLLIDRSPFWREAWLSSISRFFCSLVNVSAHS